MKLSACIEVLYPQLTFAERIKAAAEDGLSAIEFWGFPDKNLNVISRETALYGMKIAACCAGTADPKKAAAFQEYGLVCPQSPALFYELCAESAEIAEKYHIPSLIVCSGKEHPEYARSAQRENIAESLSRAAECLGGSGITLVVEPWNITKDHPGTFLSRSDEALSILKEVDAPEVKLLFDIYHQQMTEGNLTENILSMLPYIGHFHLADVPGRHEPGSGEINWKYLLEQIEQAGYAGYYGLEYLPSGDTSKTLSYLRACFADSQKPEYPAKI